MQRKRHVLSLMQIGIIMMCGIFSLGIMSGSAVAYTEDFESGAPGWVTEGTWSLITTDSHSPDHCMTDSPDANYPEDANTALVSPFIHLANTSPLILNYWQHYSFYYNNNSNDDVGLVEITNDYGLTWTLLETYKSSVSTWQYVSLDLSAYIGQIVKIRFRLVEGGTHQSDGWYIDDVSVPGTVTQEPTKIFQEDFESGATDWIPEGTWDLITTDSHSPANSMTDSPDGDYPDDANTALISPLIQLPSNAQLILTFWQHYSFYYSNNSNDDYGRVEVSTDYGLSWEQLTYYVSSVSTWHKRYLDLSAYSGQTIKLRFRLVEGGSYQSDGWYIDDVEIQWLDIIETLAIDLKVNGEDSTVFVSQGDPVDVTIELESGEYQGQNLDCWIAQISTDGNYWLDSTSTWIASLTPVPFCSGPLADIPETTIQSTTLPPGIYTYFFALDEGDGVMNLTEGLVRGDFRNVVVFGVP